MVQQSLRDLSEQIGGVLKPGKLDFASRAHLESSKSRIDRMLAPELDEYNFMRFLFFAFGHEADGRPMPRPGAMPAPR
jgi:hypothetical protein